MITLLLSFFQSKLGKQLLLTLGIIIALYSAYSYVFNSGVNYQKSLYQAEYVNNLNKMLTEQKNKQEQAYKLGFDTAKQSQETITIYRDRKPKVDEIINKANDCKMKDEVFQPYMNELKDLK